MKFNYKLLGKREMEREANAAEENRRLFKQSLLNHKKNYITKFSSLLLLYYRDKPEWRLMVQRCFAENLTKERRKALKKNGKSLKIGTNAIN